MRRGKKEGGGGEEEEEEEDLKRLKRRLETKTLLKRSLISPDSEAPLTLNSQVMKCS